jgi:hypothetical protein
MLVVISAAAIVLIELRAAGVGPGRRPRSIVRRPRTREGTTLEALPDLANLDSAPARERPILLLRALVLALASSNRLARNRDLTCRELVAQARLDTPRQREDFEHIALLAERALYAGPEAASPVIPEELLRGAQALCGEMLAGAAAAGAAR